MTFLAIGFTAASMPAMPIPEVIVGKNFKIWKNGLKNWTSGTLFQCLIYFFAGFWTETFRTSNRWWSWKFHFLKVRVDLFLESFIWFENFRSFVGILCGGSVHARSSSDPAQSQGGPGIFVFNSDIHHLTIKNHKHRRICKLDHQLSRTCGHTMLINYHDDGIIDDDNRDNNDHRRIFRWSNLIANCRANCRVRSLSATRPKNANGIYPRQGTARSFFTGPPPL